MYKNTIFPANPEIMDEVSILVLMELCIKTILKEKDFAFILSVSILVLMELCIKTEYNNDIVYETKSFNPCFNGTMYKNIDIGEIFAESSM